MKYYHVTLKSNVLGILDSGLRPSVPLDFADTKAVFLFNDVASMENALLNWLGDRIEETYGEEAECVALEIDGDVLESFNVEVIPSSAGYESFTVDSIPSQAIKVWGEV